MIETIVDMIKNNISYVTITITLLSGGKSALRYESKPPTVCRLTLFRMLFYHILSIIASIKTKSRLFRRDFNFVFILLWEL